MLFGVARIPDVRLSKTTLFLLRHGKNPLIRRQQYHILAPGRDVESAVYPCVITGRTCRWALPVSKDGGVLVPADNERTARGGSCNPHGQHTRYRLVLCACAE